MMCDDRLTKVPGPDVWSFISLSETGADLKGSDPYRYIRTDAACDAEASF